jgi:hypothetical protein
VTLAIGYVSRHDETTLSRGVGETQDILFTLGPQVISFSAPSSKVASLETALFEIASFEAAFFEAALFETAPLEAASFETAFFEAA